MSRRGGLLLLLLAAAAAGLASARLLVGPSIGDAVQEHNRENTGTRRAALHATGVYAGPPGDPAWVPLAAARPGEWLFDHPEEGQTFEEYVRFDPLRRAPGRERIVLQPLTPLTPIAQGALERVRAQCALFFCADTELAPPAELPAGAFRPARGQHDAAVLLEDLAARRPEGLLVYAGVCDQDLMIPALDNYLFGLGRFREGLGVYSFHRFYYPGIDERLYLARAFKLLTHEIGHGFGLMHCIYYRCVMNGSNSLPETDGAPLEPCPVCLRKLAYSLGFDVKERWTRLASFYDGLGLTSDAAWLRERVAALETSGREGPWEGR